MDTRLANFIDDAAVPILMEASFTPTGNAVRDVIDLRHQRGGIYGTALSIASCLTNRQVSRRVIPQRLAEIRPPFDPGAFVQSEGEHLLRLITNEPLHCCGRIV